MTSTNGNDGGSRLDRIERIVESNARAIEANSNTIAENDARTAERFVQVAELVAANTNSITILRDTVAAATATAEQANQTANNTVLSLVDGFDQLMGRIDTQGAQFLEIVGQVRDLQIQNNRILNRLEGLEGRGGQE